LTDRWALVPGIPKQQSLLLMSVTSLNSDEYTTKHLEQECQA